MEPRIESKEAFLMVGLKYTGSNPADLPGLWKQAGGRVGEIKNLAQPSVAYGVATSYDPATGVFEYIAGFGVSKVEDELIRMFGLSFLKRYSASNWKG